VINKIERYKMKYKFYDKLTKTLCDIHQLTSGDWIANSGDGITSYFCLSERTLHDLHKSLSILGITYGEVTDKLVWHKGISQNVLYKNKITKFSILNIEFENIVRLYIGEAHPFKRHYEFNNINEAKEYANKLLKRDFDKRNTLEK